MANTGRGPRRMSVPPTLETVSERYPSEYWTSAPVHLQRASSNASLAGIRSKHAEGRVQQPAAEASRLDTRPRRTSIFGAVGLCAPSYDGPYDGRPAACADGARPKLWGNGTANVSSKDPRETVLCDSPTQLDVASLPNMNKDLPPLPASSRSASPAPSAPESMLPPPPSSSSAPPSLKAGTQRAPPKRSQSASRAFPRTATDFGAFGFFPLRRATTNVSFSSDKADKDPCPTPKSILKKTTCTVPETPASDDASLLSTEASTVSAPPPSRKRVTLLEPTEPRDQFQKGLAQNIRRRSVDTVTWVAKTTTIVATKAATAVAAIPIPIPRRRSSTEEDYWSSSEEEEEETQVDLEVDWLAYGREFDPIAHELEFPPAPSEYVEDHCDFEVRVTTPSPTASTDSLVAKHLRTPAPWFPPTEDNRDDTERLSDHLRGFFDATTIAPPAFLLNGRCRSNRPLFRDVPAAAGNSGSPDMAASPVSSMLSLESEMVVTPSTSMLLHGFPCVDHKHEHIFEIADDFPSEPLTPSLDDVLVVKPTRVNARRPPRPPREYLHFG